MSCISWEVYGVSYTGLYVKIKVPGEILSPCHITKKLRFEELQDRKIHMSK